MSTATATNTTAEPEIGIAPGSPLAAKIAKIAAAIGRVKKDGRNEFHDYKYATESAILEAVRGKQAELNVAIFPSMVPGTMTVQPVGTKGDLLTTLEAKFDIVDADSGDTHTVHFPGAGTDKLDKGAYKAMTGAMKYMLQKLYQIPTGDDPEQTTDAEREGASRQPQGRPLGRSLNGPRPVEAPAPATAPQQAALPTTERPAPSSGSLPPVPPPVQQPQRASTTGARPLNGPRPLAPTPAATPLPASHQHQAASTPVAGSAPAPAPAAAPARTPGEDDADESVALSAVTLEREGTQGGKAFKLYRVVTTAGQRLAAFNDVGQQCMDAFRAGKRVVLETESTQYGPKIVEATVAR